ncbi:MAG: response regulator [Acidobacteria bacterium]|nr:response regulator [Acidobacteriota bacterium]
MTIVLYKLMSAPPGEAKQAAGAQAQPAVIHSNLLFESSPLGYIELDARGMVVRINKRELALRQISLREGLGKYYWDLAAEEEVLRTQDEIQRKLIGGVTLAPMRRRIVRPDGQQITIEVHESLLHDANGRITGMLLASTDITAQQQDQEEVFRTTTELKALFQALPDMLIRLDADGRVLDARAGQPSDCIAPPEALIGKRLPEQLPPEEGIKVAQALSRLQKNHSMVMVEITIKQRDKVEIFEARFCPNYRGESIVVIRRITEWRRSEERLEQYAQQLEQKNEELAHALANAREATEMKSRFLANMSHEIRTPMNGIIGMTEFLVATPLTTEQREYATAVKTSADSLLTLINDILDISKIEAGKMRLERLPFDLGLTVEEVAATCAIRARAKGLEFTCASSEDVPHSVVGDPGRVRQVLNNLLGNAIKFTERGKVSLFTELIGESGEALTVRFMVQDTGIGIANEHKERLFQSFVQGDNSTTRKYGGTGLGLAISKQLVEMMGGEIGFNSERGRGSTFFFTIVFERAPEVAVQPVETPALSGDRHLQGIKVLVLSSKQSSSGLRQTIQALGCRVDWMDEPARLQVNLEEAAKAGEAYRFALIDMDLHGVDSGALAATVKYEKSIRETILVAMTASPIRGDGIHLREAGYAAYLHKPVLAPQIFETFIQAMQNQVKSTPLAPAPPLITRHTLSESKKKIEGNPSVLLAEDNIINQRIALRMLQKLGLAADVVNNGKEALDAMERTAYDLILMDCQMPEMDGFEATAEIRRREGGNRHTMICALTANAMVGDREKCIDAGMDDYISKPVALVELQNALQRLLYKDEKQAETSAVSQ